MLPRRVPLLDHEPGRLVPELVVVRVQRCVEQLLTAWDPRGDRCAAGQHHKRMTVGLFGRGGHRAILHTGEPAAMLVIPQRAVQQCRNPVRRQLAHLL